MEKFSVCGGCFQAERCVGILREFLEERGYHADALSTLKTLPGSLHLHFRKRGEKSGVLELTAVPAHGEVWFSYHANRYRAWIEGAIEETELAGLPCLLSVRQSSRR